MDQNTRHIHKGGHPWMCGQHNVRASAGDSTGQNTDRGHTPNPRTDVKIPYPAGNRSRAAGLEGRDSIDHATVTDNFELYLLKLIKKLISRKLMELCILYIFKI